ncbi:MAG: polysaccharide export protein [Bacteroidetes bacterium]|nr:polysaccharide export protein [Bacteroidota bacterium]
MKAFFSIALSTFIAVGLFSCKTQNLLVQDKKQTIFQHLQPDSTFLLDTAYEYRIRKDDKVSVSFWGNDDLSVGSVYGIYNSNEVYGKWLLVDIRGNITLPRVGNYRVEGKTVAELEDSLVTVYKKWLVNPVIEVKVLNKEITILGELRNPGKYTVEKDNNTLLDLVSLAGGYEFYANLTSVKIIRQQGSTVRMVNVDMTKAADLFKRNIQLHPGDLVVVPSKKNKEFDKRISTIIPLASSTTAAAILVGTFL